MTRTVSCPECHRPAHVVERFTLESPRGPISYLRVQCEGPLSFLVSAEEVDESPQPPGTQSALVDGAA
jgi:hypothetical protein